MALSPLARVGVSGATAATLALAPAAQAQTDDAPTGTLAQSVDDPTGTAEMGIGWLTLPGAEVCVERDESGCRKGDSSFALEAWQMFRTSASFAAGAGLLLGLTPVTDAPRRDPEGIERDHTRRYFTVETAVRYYPYVGESIEFWVGATGGLVVVSDSFTVDPAVPDNRALVGSRGVTIRTEGLTLGIAGGVGYLFAPGWLLGGNLRYSSWFLPGEPETNALGDEASLAGRNSALSVGASIAYRLSL